MKKYLLISKSVIQIIRIKGNRVNYSKSIAWKGDVQSLKEFLRGLPFSTRKVTLLLPSDRFFIKSLRLPLVSKGKLDKLINLNFLEKLPVSRESLYYSYYSRQVNKQELLLTVFAVKKKIIDNYIGISRKLRLKIKGIYPLGALHYIQQKEFVTKSAEINTDKKIVIMATIDQLYQHYTVIDGEEVYLRSCPGGKEADIIDELQRIYNFYQDNREIKPVKWLYINGQGYNIASVSSFIEIISKERQDSNLLANRFSKRELKRLDIQGKTERYQGRKEKRRLAVVWLLFFLILLTGTATLGIKYYFASERLALLEYSSEELEPELERVKQMKEKYAQNNNMLEVYQGIIEEDNQAYLPWLLELSRNLSPDVKIETLNFKGDKLILLEGRASSAVDLLASLDNSPLFVNVHFVGSISSNQQGEEFRIAGDLVHENF